MNKQPNCVWVFTSKIKGKDLTGSTVLFANLEKALKHANLADEYPWTLYSSHATKRVYYHRQRPNLSNPELIMVEDIKLLKVRDD